MILDYPYYEEELSKREVAKCCECGASIYNTEDYYLVGDEYICEVAPGEKHHFLVLGEEDNKINLIMNHNILEKTI